MPETATKPKVLLVFSEKVIADTLAIVLNQTGFEARATYSGENAIDQAPQFKPDLLISDVVTIGMDGVVDVAIRICDILPSVKVLLFSGCGSAADLLVKARTKGYDFPLFASPRSPSRPDPHAS